MTSSSPPPSSIHLDGGNFYDDLRIDIAEAHRRLDSLPRQPRSIHRSALRNRINRLFSSFCLRFGFHEALVMLGLKRRWLSEFRSYWTEILEGRPLWNMLDFFMLLHEYRKRQQHTVGLDWDSAEQHVANWQDPSQIYAILQNVRILATYPVPCPELWKQVPRGAKVLEYGCSLAPYYYSYREGYSHLDCQWSLLDLPNFPFHYARWLYRNDEGTECLTLTPESFRDPLGEAKDFDVIILTTVMEHLDDPMFIIEYLHERLNPGGLLLFDYVKSEGTGLDHPKALEERGRCLDYLKQHFEIIHGHIGDPSEDVGLCLGRKRS